MKNSSDKKKLNINYFRLILIFLAYTEIVFEWLWICVQQPKTINEWSKKKKKQVLPNIDKLIHCTWRIFLKLIHYSSITSEYFKLPISGQWIILFEVSIIDSNIAVQLYVFLMGNGSIFTLHHMWTYSPAAQCSHDNIQTRNLMLK